MFGFTPGSEIRTLPWFLQSLHDIAADTFLVLFSQRNIYGKFETRIILAVTFIHFIAALWYGANTAPYPIAYGKYFLNRILCHTITLALHTAGILVLYLVQRLPLDGRTRQIAQIVIIIIGIISLLKYLAVF